MMQVKVVIVFFIVTTLLVGIVVASSSMGPLSGTRYRAIQRIDPYSREKYFGEGYVKPVLGFGRKDGGITIDNGINGRKGMSGNRNILYNSLYREGRNPQRISHYDSGFKGAKIIDKVILLRSVNVLERDNKSVYTNGFVRLYSQQYDSKALLPYSEVYIKLVNALPSNDTETLGAWLVDENTGYSLHLGNFMVNLRGTGSFQYKAYQYLGVYDTVLITREPMPATDPFPHESILIGDIK